MENLETNARRSQERGSAGQQYNDKAYGDYADLVSAELLDDPAVFYIFELVRLTNMNRVSELKSFFAGNPELLDLVDTVLLRMEEVGLLKIQGDNIICPKRFIDFGSNPTALKRFLPNLLRIAAQRVLKNEEENPERRKANKEIVRWFTLSNSPEIAAEAREIDLEYKAKLMALQEKAYREGTKEASGVRLIGMVNCVMDPEDFG